jgi:hypothetical protein
MSARPDQCWLTFRRWYLNCDSCLMYECVRTGNHIVRTMYQSSHIWTWKESEADRSLMDVQTGCWDVRTDASWNRSFSIQWKVRTDDAGLSGVRSGWTRRPDGWNSGQMSSGRLIGNLKSSIFFTVQSLLKNALTSGIPVYSVFTYKWFCQNTKWGQNTNKTLRELAYFSLFIPKHPL